MPWVEVFAAFVVCHLVGDYLLQTDWQALNKRGGLGSDPQARRALVSHVISYTLAFVPALIWVADDIGAWAVGAAALIGGPHLVQDDGRLLTIYMLRAKHTDPRAHPGVAGAAPQTLPLLAPFLPA